MAKQKISQFQSLTETLSCIERELAERLQKKKNEELDEKQTQIEETEDAPKPLVASSSKHSSSYEQYRLGETLLKAADGPKEEVLRLLGAGADVNFKGEGGITPLTRAVNCGLAETVSALLLGGAKVESRNCYGQTALHLAVENPDPRCVISLLTSNANVNSRDDCGFTPLHIAASLGNASAVNVLLRAGAKKTVACDEGLTPYDLAEGELRHLLRP